VLGITSILLPICALACRPFEDKNPVVIGRLGHDPTKPTVTFYGHYVSLMGIGMLAFLYIASMVYVTRVIGSAGQQMLDVVLAGHASGPPRCLQLIT
jgi:hypothetical protein